MNIKKLAPWNWFKKEDNDSGYAVPVKQKTQHSSNELSGDLHDRFTDDMDRLFDHFFNGHGLSVLRPWGRMQEELPGNILKPSLDLGATENGYSISMEIPGVSEKEVTIELLGDTLVIRGEKKQTREDKNKNYYRVERSYGSFQRTLSLPGDADQARVEAKFNNGVLKITIPRLKPVEHQPKQIEVKYA